MTAVNPLSKRIKRQVTGRTRTFFLVTAPGLRQLCFKEINKIPGFNGDVNIVGGGIEFTGRLRDCYLANLYLRTASRILMRIDGFDATNFRQLERKLSDIPWELYLYRGMPLKLNITVRRSRLYHTVAIEERVGRCISNRLEKSGQNPSGVRKTFDIQHVFIRVENDHFILSMDTSGRLLYKRGIKTDGAPAPMRETIAAAVLIRAGYDHTRPLVDPMCGSGTFSIEAAMMAKHIPAGYYRDFVFMGWPGFKERQWAYLKRQAAGEIKQMIKPCIFASDINKKRCRILEDCVRRHQLNDCIDVTVGDFFDLNTNKNIKPPGLIVINPPYGRRMGNPKNSRSLIIDICNRLKRDYTGWKTALLVPDFYVLGKIPLKLNVHPLYHGGLKMKLLEGTIS